jgi:hypothetical protein
MKTCLDNRESITLISINIVFDDLVAQGLLVNECIDVLLHILINHIFLIESCVKIVPLSMNLNGPMDLGSSEFQQERAKIEFLNSDPSAEALIYCFDGPTSKG